MTEQVLTGIGISVVIVVSVALVLFLRYLPIYKPSQTVTTTVDLQLLQYSLSQLQEMSVKFDAREAELTKEIDKRDQRIAQLEQQIDELRKKLEHLTNSLPETISKTGKGFTILAIWPDTQTLRIAEERDAIYNAGFDYIPLYDEAAIRPNIIEHMRSGVVSVIEVGAHGTTDGVMLHDGLAEPGWWSRMLRRYPVDLIVLLACDSFEIARALNRESVPYVVAAADEIEDQYAIRFVMTFYNGLAANMPVTEAFEDAKLAIPLSVGEMVMLVVSEERQTQMQRRQSLSAYRPTNKG